MTILEYLQSNVAGRERSNKNKVIAHILSMRYLQLGAVEKKIITDIAGDVLTMDRAWRKALADNPGLRGKDYNDKDELVERKQAELGYLTP